MGGEKAEKFVYGFGDGRADGDGGQKALLGGKGANLAEMSRLGIPVPPGFTLTTDVCRRYQESDGDYPATLREEVEQHLSKLEELMGQGFGNPERPLLVSVRSGGPISMPGMMDTVLNLGLNDEIVAAPADQTARRFLLDCYRRLLAMYGDVVVHLPMEEFDAALEERRNRVGGDERDLGTSDVEALVEEYKTIFERHGNSFPQDPREQLWGAIGAVFASWNNKRATSYRRLHDISADLGTGVNVQTMVFGNQGPDCGTGVAFSRDPSTGERRLYGEYLANAQGEDVVAGTHTPKAIQGDNGDSGLADDFPAAAGELAQICETLEKHFADMQDVEFTIQNDKLFMLQTRTGKRSGPAAVRTAVDMVHEGLIDRATAILRVEPDHVIQLLAPELDPEGREAALAAGQLIGHGLPAGPGAASGRIAFTAERAQEMAAKGPVILVRNETSPEDIVGMNAASGILTTRGGMTSHAAVVARGLGKPCVVGAGSLIVDEHVGLLRSGERVLQEGELLSIEGARAEVFSGGIATYSSEALQVLRDPRPEARQDCGPAAAALLELLGWADELRRLKVRANADTPEDSEVAVTLGAEGIGLCRTEHMFFHEERISWVRQMILAPGRSERSAALAKLLPVQQRDFEGIFRALDGRPVTIRLLDPPLHEFLPRRESALDELASKMGLDSETVADRVEALVEANPMLGHRGCRLGITAPEIYEMQVEAIVRAAVAVAGAGISVLPEIMVPLTGTKSEMASLRERIETVSRRVLQQQGSPKIDILIGTMIEVPRAALVADELAEVADFFSFGTNDLTQMTFGFSRDDAGAFLPTYVEAGILPADPFATLDRGGVGQLVRLGTDQGRSVNPSLKVGVCGEHGGDGRSIEFFESCELDYVSCSPYRVPVARLAAARAALSQAAQDSGAS